MRTVIPEHPCLPVIICHVPCRWQWPPLSPISRAVQIDLFTAQILGRALYRVFEYSADTGSSY